jgi:hypothetical protein
MMENAEHANIDEILESIDGGNEVGSTAGH